MKALLFCIAAFLTGAFLLEQEGLWAGFVGAGTTLVLLACPAHLFLKWLTPLPKENEND